ncbi:MAG: hypothetical protein SGI97_05335 [candidate division Zixibacteria bacterium]|nr:hypothetical protein [candidate division Zixibacteria bacterium]
MYQSSRTKTCFSRPTSGPKPFGAFALLILVIALLCFSADDLHAQSCCTVRGNVDCSPDGVIDISDLSALIDYLFISLAPTCCDSAGNLDGSPDGVIDISDLSVLIDYMFITYESPAPCEDGNMLSAEARMAVVDDVTHLLDSLTSDPNVYIKIRDFLNSRPEIDSAGIVYSPSTVWALFVDSVLLLVTNNRPPSSGLPTEAREDEIIVPYESRSRPLDNDPYPIKREVGHPRPPIVNSGLPASLQARLLNTLGNNLFSPVTQTLANWLNAGGYVATTPDETVEALRTVGGDGVFFYSTHGGAGYFSLDSADMAYALWTSTISTRANLPNYITDLKHKRLAIQVGPFDIMPNGDTIVQAHYGITSKFVDHYWGNFAANSMVYIDACGSDGPFAQPMKQAMLAKNAGVYFGWSYSVFSDASNLVAQFMIDRLLGANLYQSYKESPPQRPFDMVSIYGDLQSRNLHAHPTTDSLVAPGKKTVFQYTAGTGDFGILSPSIRYMAVVEHFDTLYITGFFGSDPGSKGRVIVGGTELPIYSWEPGMIFAFIPNTGVGSVGPVTVEIDGLTGPSSSTKRKSNVVNLTEWHGLFTYKADDFGSLLGKIVIDAHFRADVHSFRDFPHTTPGYYSVVFPAMDDSYGTASVSGGASYINNDNDPPDTTTWTWFGSQPLVSLWEQDPTGFLMTGFIVQNPRKLHLRLAAAKNGGLKEKIIYTPGGSEIINDLTIGIPFELYDFFTGLFYIDMNNVWDILGNQRTYFRCCSRDPNNPDALPDVLHSLSWPTIPASWAPDTSAAQ